MHKITKLSAVALFGAITMAVSTACGGGPKASFTMWTGFGSSYTMFLEKLTSYELDKKSIKIDHSSKGSYDNLQKAINESIPTLDYPTIANGYPDHFASYIRTQIQIPLNEYIARYDQEHGTNLLEDYYSDYMKENETLAYKSDGTPYVMGLPFNKSTELLGYNGYFVDYAKQEGVITEMPKTWQEWAEKGQDLRELQLSMCGKYLHGKKSEDGTASDMVLNSVATGDDILLDMSLVEPTNSRLMSWDASDNMFITIVRQWGSTYTTYTAEDAKKTNPHGYIEFYTEANKAKTIAALEFFNTLFGDKQQASATYTPDYKSQIFGLPANFGGLFSSDAFKANQVMFTVCSSGGLSYNTGGTQRFRVAPIPFYKAEESGQMVQRKYVISQGTNLALFDQGSEDVKQKAFDAIVDFTTGELQAAWVVDTGYFPASKSATQCESYKNMINSTDYSNATVVAYRESNKVNDDYYMKDGEGWEKFVDPGFVGSSKIRSTCKDILSSVFNHVGIDQTYDQILQEACNVLKDYVRK